MIVINSTLYIILCTSGILIKTENTEYVFFDQNPPFESGRCNASGFYNVAIFKKNK